MTEKEFQDKVTHLAKMHGWAVHHVSPHMVRPGVFRSDTPGWPDLTLVRRTGDTTEIIFAELKTDTGRVDDKQKYWLDQLSGGYECYVWRPMNFITIVHRLGSRQILPAMKALQWV